MNERETTLTVSATDGTEIVCNRWQPTGQAKAIVLIVHGLAEHSARYARLADRLTAAGYAVYAPDHRGHGRTAERAEAHGGKAFGVFADKDGWPVVVGDLRAVAHQARADHPGLPVFLLGHSMGSFLARSYAIAHGAELSGVVLSGTGADPGLLGKVGALVAGVQGRVRGRARQSPLMDKLSFGQFNAAFKPNRTGYDWLSRDEAEVDAYIADPWCGQISSAGMFSDLLAGLAGVNKDASVARVPKALPVLLISGELDPVGGAKAVASVAAQFRRAGLLDVTEKVYPQARHEIFNETNRDQVFDDVVGWLDTRLAGRSGTPAR
jgi:alpha-beta hydrolase superfamily lysophospholipase